MAIKKSIHSSHTTSTATNPGYWLGHGGGAPTKPPAEAQSHHFFSDKLRPGRGLASRLPTRPAPSRGGGKSSQMNMLGGRRLWRNAKSHANKQQNVRATLNAIAAGILCTAGAGVHYTSKAVGTAIRHAHQ